MHSFEKLVDLGSAARVCVMCQNISGWLTVDCLIIYKVLPIVSHIFHQKSATLAYVLEVTVTLSPFAQTSFANPLLHHEVFFLFFDFFSLTVFYTTITFAFVICLIKRYQSIIHTYNRGY